jgi:hypothetical protein
VEDISRCCSGKVTGSPQQRGRRLSRCGLDVQESPTFGDRRQATSGRGGGRSGRHMRVHCWFGKGQARAKDLFTTVWRPETACQTTCLEENARQRTHLPASRNGLRGTGIGQTHNDISGTIIGQMRPDQIALQLVKRTTTLPEWLLVKCSQRGRTEWATVGI